MSNPDNTSRATVLQLSGRHGRLTILERAPTPLGQRKAFWHCRCDCGAEFVKRGTDINVGRGLACRLCIRRDRVGKPKERARATVCRSITGPHWQRDKHPLHQVMRAWVSA